MNKSQDISKIKIKLIKAPDSYTPDRATIEAKNGTRIELEIAPHSDEVSLWFARYAVESHFKLRGALRQIGLVNGSEVKKRDEIFESELIVKILLDAQYLGRPDPGGVRETILLMYQSLLFGRTPRAQAQVSLRALTDCIDFLHEAKSSWTMLGRGQHVDLELSDL